MSFPSTAFKRSSLSLLLFCLATLSVFSQAANSPISFNSSDAIVTSFVQAPSLGSASSVGNSKWLKIEFHYAIALPNGNTGTYLDELQFKVWVEGVDLSADNPSAPGQGVAVGLTGSVTYTNLPVGKDVYGVFYVPPAALEHYSKTTSDFDRKFDVHVEASQGGTVMDSIDKNKEQDPTWYKKLTPIAGVVCRQNQCPFIISDPDRYPPIKLPDGDK